MDDDFGSMTGSWSPEHIQAALDQALKLREAGNQAFHAGHYKCSTETYGEASYDVLPLKSIRTLGGIPFNDQSFTAKITEMQFIACSKEAASWLKYEEYDDEDSRYQKALNCTSMALDALKDHPKAWKPSNKAMGKLLYRRARAYVELGLCDDAESTLEKVKRLGVEDDAVRLLGNKNVRQFGLDALPEGMVPLPIPTSPLAKFGRPGRH